MDEASLIFPEFGTGSCINCGFLAFSRRGDLSEVIELPMGRRANPAGLSGWLFCFIHAADLRAEMVDLEEQGVPGDQRQRQILEKGRNCSRWYAWRPGFDSRWHYEEVRMRQLEDERRRFETHLSERAEQAEQRRYNLGLLITVAAVILAVGEVVAAILGAGPGSILGDLLGLR